MVAVLERCARITRSGRPPAGMRGPAGSCTTFPAVPRIASLRRRRSRLRRLRDLDRHRHRAPGRRRPATRRGSGDRGVAHPGALGIRPARQRRRCLPHRLRPAVRPDARAAVRPRRHDPVRGRRGVAACPPPGSRVQRPSGHQRRGPGRVVHREHREHRPEDVLLVDANQYGRFALATSLRPGVRAEERRSWQARCSLPSSTSEAAARPGSAPAIERASGPWGRGGPDAGVGPGRLRQDDAADGVADRRRYWGTVDGVARARSAGQRPGRVLDLPSRRTAEDGARGGCRRARAPAVVPGVDGRGPRDPDQRPRCRHGRRGAGTRRLPRRHGARRARGDGLPARAPAPADPPGDRDPRRSGAAVGAVAGARRARRGPCRRPALHRRGCRGVPERGDGIAADGAGRRSAGGPHGGVDRRPPAGGALDAGPGRRRRLHRGHPDRAGPTPRRDGHLHARTGGRDDAGLAGGAGLACTAGGAGRAGLAGAAGGGGHARGDERAVPRAQRSRGREAAPGGERGAGRAPSDR